MTDDIPSSEKRETRSSTRSRPTTEELQVLVREGLEAQRNMRQVTDAMQVMTSDDRKMVSR